MTQIEVQNNPLLQGINWEKAAKVFAMIDMQDEFKVVLEGRLCIIIN